ncbi:MAG: SDR family NAD(P)-dependent oxidoreductase [Arenibacterium sp.]
MKTWQGKTYWLIGASEGLGAALARKLSNAGVHVVLSARNEDRLNALASDLSGPSTVQPVDVSSLDSLKQAADAIGPVDGVVYLAGVYWPMPSTQWQAEEAEAMADINFTGLVRAMGVVLPDMVERDSGHVVITGSLSAFRGLPGAIGYAASKAGTLALAESMYADLRKTGVQVQIANPGFIRTRLTDKNDFTMPFIMEPDDAAQVMFEHMNTNRFKLSFPRPFSWVFRLSTLLPDSIYFRLFA